MSKENITFMFENTLGTENTDNYLKDETMVYNTQTEIQDNNTNNDFQSIHSLTDNTSVNLIDSNETNVLSTQMNIDLPNTTDSLNIINPNNDESLIENSSINMVPNQFSMIQIDPTIPPELFMPITTQIVKIIPDDNINPPVESVSKNRISIPKIVFIVPYRDRKQHYMFFSNHMKQILEDVNDYKIAYIHQQDERSFNRGAIKNIGFLIIKELYPNHYKDITFVFNDIDTMPYTKNFLNYHTVSGTIKHFYGYNWALGGIVCINGDDFEKMNGFPNYWAWGYEDNLLNVRAKRNNILIDRSQFYPIMDKNILQLKDGITRIVNRNEFDKYMINSPDGITSITNVKYENDTKLPEFYNVYDFSTGTTENIMYDQIYNTTQPTPPFSVKPAPTKRMRMVML